MKSKILLFVSLFVINAVCFSSRVLILAPTYSSFLALKKYIKKPIVKDFKGEITLYGEMNGIGVILSRCGIGSVNSSVSETLLTERVFPSLIILSGVAGGLQKKIKLGDIVVGKTIFSADDGVFSGSSVKPSVYYSVLKKEKAPMIYHSNNTVLKDSKSLSHEFSYKVYYGSIVSDQTFPDNKAIKKRLIKEGDLAIAMEDMPLAQTAWIFNIPFLDVRGISDTTNGVPYTRKHKIIAADHAAFFVYKLLGNIKNKFGAH